MTDRPARHPPSPAHSGGPAPVEHVEIQSRAHRPLVFEVPGHGPVRLAAFETIKLPAFAVDTPALRTLLAEGSAIVLAKEMKDKKEEKAKKEEAPAPEAAPESEKAAGAERRGRKRAEHEDS